MLLYFQCFKQFQNDSYIGEYEAIWKDKIFGFFNGSSSTDPFLTKYAELYVKQFLNALNFRDLKDAYLSGDTLLNKYKSMVKPELECLKTKVHNITRHINDCAEGKNTLTYLVGRAADTSLKNECSGEKIMKEELTNVIKKVMIDRGLQQQCEKNKL